MNEKLPDDHKLIEIATALAGTRQVIAVLLVGSAAVRPDDLSPYSDIDLEIVVKGQHVHRRGIRTVDGWLFDYHIVSLDTLEKGVNSSKAGYPAYKLVKLSNCRVLQDLNGVTRHLLQNAKQLYTAGVEFTKLDCIYREVELMELRDDILDSLTATDGDVVAALLKARYANRIASILFEVEGKYETPLKNIYTAISDEGVFICNQLSLLMRDQDKYVACDRVCLLYNLMKKKLSSDIGPEWEVDWSATAKL